MIHHSLWLILIRMRPSVPVVSLLGAIAPIPFMSTAAWSAIADPICAEHDVSSHQFWAYHYLDRVASANCSFAVAGVDAPLAQGWGLLSGDGSELEVWTHRAPNTDDVGESAHAQAPETAATDAQSSNSEDSQTTRQSTAQPPTPESLNLDSELVDDSPVFQRWLDEIPDVAADIRRDPSFRTRLRFGYAEVLSTDDGSGFLLGVEDVFVGNTRLTLAADYQATFGGDRQSYGAEARYYLAPLGGYVNVAPVVGYRSLETRGDRTEGLSLGVRLMIVPSRTGAADLAVSQRWIAPRDRDQASLTSLSLGYAITRNWRLSTEFQWQRTPDDDSTRLGAALEWMP